MNFSLLSLASVQVSGVTSGIPQLPFNTRVRLEVENQESRPLYISVIVVTSTGELVLIFPNQWAADAEAAKVEAGSVRRVPDKAQGDEFELVIDGPTGTAEVLVVASTWPLRDSLRVAQQQATRGGTRSGEAMVLENPQDMVEKLLMDVDKGSRRRTDVRNLFAKGTKRAMDAAEIAAVSITFQAVEPAEKRPYGSRCPGAAPQKRAASCVRRPNS